MLRDKKTLRRHFLTCRANLGVEEKRKLDKDITRAILSFKLYQKAECIFIYVSSPNEIDTHFIIFDALKSGKTVCVPRCGEAGQMTARRIISLSELAPGAHGILEPCADSDIVEYPELVIAPALACDKNGYRLGYGGGYYDRFLSRNHMDCIALCAYERILNELPHDKYDQRCQWIATERQVLCTDEKQ